MAVLRRRGSSSSGTSGGGGGGSSAPAKELVILADSRSTATSGQTTLQLPVNYTEYKNYEIVVGEAENVIDVLRGTTNWLSEQEDGDNVKIGFVDKDEAGSRRWITWTPSTRTFALGRQGTADTAARFKSSRLYDGGGTVTTSGGGSLSAQDQAKLAGITVNNETAAREAADAALSGRINTNAGNITSLENITRSNELSLVGVREDLEHTGDVQSVTISTASSYQSTLNSQDGSSRPLILVIDADISGIRGGARYSFSAGDVLWIPPTSDVTEFLFNLPTGSSGLTQSQVDARIQAGVSDWAEQGNTDPIPAAKLTNAPSGGGGTDTTARTAAATALSRTQRLRPVNNYVRFGGAQTLLLEWKPAVAVANNAPLRVNVGGANISGVTSPEAIAAGDLQGTILSIPINAANSGSIDRSSNTSEGHVEIQITHGSVVDSTWVGVIKSADWRPLAGAGPYTVRSDDTEFMVVMTHTESSRVLRFRRYIPRRDLTTTPVIEPISEANPSQSDLTSFIGFAISLSLIHI